MTTGRARLYFPGARRKAASTRRRSKRDGAVKLQLVEKFVTAIRELRVEVPHPRRDCIESEFNEDAALARVVWVLIDRVHNHDNNAFGTDKARLWDPYNNNVCVLHDATMVRASSDQRGRL